MSRLISALLLGVVVFTACEKETSIAPKVIDWKFDQVPSDYVFQVKGLNEPEAVKYDPTNDVYYISNFNGGGSAADSNGFVSLVSAEGELLDKRYLVGSDSLPLHAPRGLMLTGNALWVTDVNGIHVYDTSSRKQISYFDFRGYKPGFINDITMDSDGVVYITDTGARRVYKIQGSRHSVMLDSLPIQPNGIAYDELNKMLVLATWGGPKEYYAYDMVLDTLVQFGEAEGGGFFDGVEFVEGAMLTASQADSSIRIMENGFEQALIKVGGRPADIAIDKKRMRVAVPYIALDRVDFFDLTIKDDN